MATVELTMDLLAEIGGWPALKEARGLVERGRVSDARREGDVVRARVQGGERAYESRITLAERVAGVEVRCSCAEFRRTGRVCAHALAAGLAWMKACTAKEMPVRGVVDQRPAAQEVRRLPRWLIDEAPLGAVAMELGVLLPLQLAEALGRDPVRIILEAERGGETLPFDAARRGLEKGFAVSEEDDRVLTALEKATGSAGGINAVPRARIGIVLRALSGHPRVWVGKKERIEVRAAEERARIVLRTREDGGLEMDLPRQPADGGPARAGWQVQGNQLMETAPWPAGFSSGTRVIAPGLIPDFLTREFPALERNCELVFAPGFEEFQLEIGEPVIEARLEGALSGVTLELVARYGEGQGAREFAVTSKTEPGAYQRYLPDASRANRFWRRNVIAERAALAQAEDAGFALVRNSATTLSLIQENNVARFLANRLPRWRRSWVVKFGARLESTMAEVDIAQPEFSLRSGGDRAGGAGHDWLSLDLKLAVGGKPIALEPAEIQRWLQTGQSHTRTANRRVLLVPTEAWGEMREVLADCAVEQEPGRIRVGRMQAPFLAGALAANGFSAKENVAADFVRPEVGSAVGAELWARLRPYQAQGVEWLAGLAVRGFHGLLGDDMGLGKTVQALVFWEWVRGEGRKKKEKGKRGEIDGAENVDLRAKSGERGEGDAAVARGATVGAEAELILRQAQDDGGGRGEAQLRGQVRSQEQLGNEGTGGQAELILQQAQDDGEVGNVGTFPHSARALVVCPTSLVTNWLREAGRFLPRMRALDLTGADRAEKFSRRGEFDLLVTSYAILRRDVELYRGEEFALVILDEAQQIKNRGSQNAQAAKALRARHRLILSGTPLENSVLDLWSLFDFLLPGYLGSAADFKERYEGPLTKAPEPKLMERLRQRVRPFFLRRTKEEVLKELPPKLEFPTLVELSEEQREVYRAVLAQGRREVFERSGKADRKAGRDRLAVLTTLLRLRQVCCHLALLPKEDQREAEFREGQERSQVELGNEGTSASRWKEPSAKMERAFELIDEAVEGGHRVLVFSQFVRVLHLLRDEAKRRELRFCYLDGQTVERQAEVDRFQNDGGIPMFFISLKAGGTGLNLTGADTVIHFDPWWNPAVEEQATSRAHRMGQARSVSAYKLIAAGTVEEKIQALQARKRELFEASLGGGDAAFVEKLSGEDLEELLAE